MSRMKTCHIPHREYFINLERNAYSWRIAAITHRLGNSFLPASTFFYPNQAAAAECARAAIDRHLNAVALKDANAPSTGSSSARTFECNDM